MKLKYSDAQLIQAKESPYPTLFVLTDDHLKPEARDIGFFDARDLKDEVNMRIDLADVVLLVHNGQTKVIKDSTSINVMQF